MGGVGVSSARAHLLLWAGAGMVVAAVFLLGGVAWALLVAGILVVAYALLLVDVQSPVPAVPVPGDATRVGR